MVYSTKVTTTSRVVGSIEIDLWKNQTVPIASSKTISTVGSSFFFSPLASPSFLDFCLFPLSRITLDSCTRIPESSWIFRVRRDVLFSHPLAWTERTQYGMYKLLLLSIFFFHSPHFDTSPHSKAAVIKLLVSFFFFFFVLWTSA